MENEITEKEIMSRSNPIDHIANPCTRWMEWDGSQGRLRYYDKTKKENIPVAMGFQFILLDTLATVKGWNDATDSGIYSNEVRDTKQEVFVVKAFKGGIIAQGHYQSIRDRVAAAGGNYAQNCYVAFKDESGKIVLGSVALKGAALNSWIEFGKANLGDLYKKSVKIESYVEGKKGAITFRVPKFVIAEITPETNAEAMELDKILQEFLKSYFRRTRTEQAEHVGVQEDAPVDPPTPANDHEGEAEVPF